MIKELTEDGKSRKGEPTKPAASPDDAGGILLKYEPLRITPETVIPAPIPLITINGEMITSEDNITTISGGSKSGKSAFTAVIIAGAISKDGIINDPFSPMEIAPNPTGKAVIHFDTEQARHKHQRNVKSILKRAGLSANPDYYLSYNIRELDIAEYDKTTTSICQAAHDLFNGIHLIVIDGGADFIADVNDLAESKRIVQYFMWLSSKFHTPILIVVHTNPNGIKERGHFGSECQRRSEAILNIQQKDDISFIVPTFLRDAGKAAISQIKFTYSKEKGYHVLCNAEVSKKIDKDAQQFELSKKYCKEVFSVPESLKYDTAIDKIMKASKKSITIAKGFFTTMKAHEMIKSDIKDFWRMNADYREAV